VAEIIAKLLSVKMRQIDSGHLLCIPWLESTIINFRIAISQCYSIYWSLYKPLICCHE